jgi:GNAT superfamily N-acetyltransferase
VTTETRHPALHRYEPAAPSAFDPTIRPWLEDRERAFVAHSWRESYKDSPETRRLKWPDYKALYVPVLDAILDRPDTTVLVAADPANIVVGWIAFARWPSIDTVHWLWVQMQHRRRGVARALLATLRARIAYTHRAPIRRRQVRADLMLGDKLRARGVVVSHVPYQEWSR